MFYLYFQDAARVLHALRNKEGAHVAYVDLEDARQRAVAESLLSQTRSIFAIPDTSRAVAFTIDQRSDLDQTRGGVPVTPDSGMQAKTYTT